MVWAFNHVDLPILEIVLIQNWIDPAHMWLVLRLKQQCYQIRVSNRYVYLRSFLQGSGSRRAGGSPRKSFKCTSWHLNPRKCQKRFPNSLKNYITKLANMISSACLIAGGNPHLRSHLFENLFCVLGIQTVEYRWTYPSNVQFIIMKIDRKFSLPLLYLDDGEWDPNYPLATPVMWLFEISVSMLDLSQLQLTHGAGSSVTIERVRYYHSWVACCP